MVTRSWDTIPLHLKITLWIFSAPFAITEVTLLTMYVFLTNNTFVTITHGLANAFKFKKFFPKFQDHLLGQLISREFDANMHKEFMDSDRNSIHFVGVIVLIFWFVQVASTHKQLLPFPYLHMFLLIFTYATMDDISIPWIAQLCLVSKHMFV